MSKYKILIIEDDDDIRISIKMLLQSENFEIIEANNGNIGIEKFNDSINLIILDIMMPGISGLEVCEIIRRESIVPMTYIGISIQIKLFLTESVLHMKKMVISSFIVW